MRVAILSDIHGNLFALDAVLADLKRQAPDRVIVAGDLAWGGSRPEEVITKLLECGWPMIAGNTDRWLVFDNPPGNPLYQWTRERLSAPSLRFLAELPLEHRVSVSGRADILVVHSAPGDPDVWVDPDAPDDEFRRIIGKVDTAWVARGHDHHVYVKFVGGLTLVGVGSVGLPWDGDVRAAYALFDWSDQGAWQVHHRRVPYDVEAAVKDVIAQHLPDESVKVPMLRTGIRPR